MRELAFLAAIAGAVVAVIFFILANGEDTEWGLASFAISWAIYLFTGYLPSYRHPA